MREGEYTKRCSSCDEVKPITEFHRRSGTPDGRQYVCAPCGNAQRAALRSNQTSHTRGTSPVQLNVRVHPKIKAQVADLADAMGMSQARVVSNLLTLALNNVQQRRG